MKLFTFITAYGHSDWKEIPTFTGLSRSRRRCRLRWFNYLRPGLKRGTYSEKEEDDIVKLYEILGNSWTVIACHLPGRTAQGIKRHWEGKAKEENWRERK
ncbi:Myb transcription factor [Quillaja saponaria]|uniref:Myb transcription factor n=1 Tax=Quillaja saponaria TaxID=32244 RepID=A0AAD7L1D5_QUISA|nr:Myb transcription factor [Quillaja saponaria]